MHTSRVIPTRVAFGVAVTIGLLFVEAELLTPPDAAFKTVYADAGATPSPTLPSGVAPLGLATPNVTPSPTLPSGVAPLGLATPNLTPTPTTATTATSPSQAASDQIATIAAHVAQITHDPTLSVDVKTTQIYALATQFNQQVVLWQQQVQAIGVQGSPNGLQPNPSVSTTQTVSPVTISAPSALQTPTAVPTVMPGTDISQLRAQIVQVAQQMGTVSQDPALSAEQKTAQLSALAARFNQLTLQLQQQGG
jgi:hypothetical protein